jgi:hypothetical protein
MASKTTLKILFFCIFGTMLLYTSWASTRQPVWQWSGLTAGADRYWTTATLLDAYCGFITFYVWVVYKESGWWTRLFWFLAIMALGNMAMSSYVLLQLFRLRPDQPVSAILTKQPSRITETS